ncbi:MAG: FAD-binding oxidoreductase [Pseudomonadota bacterium]
MGAQSTHYDIAIIGAGVAGLSAAYFLSAGARVIVLERESQPAYHSSGRSAAMYIEGYENVVVSELTSAGKDFFFSPPADPDGTARNHPLVKACGGLTIAGPGEEARLQKYLTTWQTHCPELAPISTSDCLAMLPILKSDWLQAAAYDPSWHTIDVHELLTVYQRGLRQRDGALQTGVRLESLTREAEGWQLHTADGQISANIVVNAAGAWANGVAGLAGVPALPLTPLRRSAAIIPAPEGAADWPLVHTISENLYFKPESGGLMICPQDETPSAPVDAAPEEMDLAVAAARFEEITDHPVTRLSHQWAGLRTFAEDRRPVVGFDPESSGFFWLAGQGGFGVQTSPALGQRVAEQILHNRPPEPELDVARYRAR